MLKNRLFFKIILVFTLPALGILFFSTKLVFEKIEYVNDIYRTLNNVEYVNKSNTFINSLQKEFEIASKLLNSQTSQENFDFQINNTNDTYLYYLNFLENYLKDYSNENFENKIKEIKDNIKQLNLVRDKVYKKDLNQLELLDFYTSMNNLFLSSIGSIQTVNLIYDFNKEYLNLLHFFNLKTNIFVENILTAEVLRNGKLDGDTYKLLLNSYSIQSENLNYFNNSSSSKILDIYKKMIDENIEEKVKKIRNDLDTIIIDESFSIEQWLNISSQRIIIHENIFNEIMTLLHKEAVDLKNNAVTIDYFSKIYLIMIFVTLISLLFLLKNIIYNEQASYEKVKKQKKVYELLNQVNKFILKKNDKEDLYKEINRIISINPDMVFSFLYDLQAKEENRIYALDGHLKNLLKGRLEDYKKNNNDNLLSRVIDEDKQIIVEDFKKKNISVFYKYARKFDINSAAAFPIRKFDKIVSVLVIYSNKLNFFDYEVQILFEKMISDMEHVLERLDYEKLRLKQEKQLRISSVAFESSEPMIIADENANIIDANQAFCEFMKYPKRSLLGRNPRIFKSSYQDKNFYLNMWESISNKNSWSGEIYNTNGDDEIVPVRLTITAIKDEDGNITNYLGQYIDISDLKTKEKMLQYQATHDNLTKLPNRLLLLDRIEHAIKKALRHKHYGALIFIDLDNFKEINDTLGHDIGDLLLIDVANKLKDVVREEDTVSRIGGDEFIVLADNIGLNDVEAKGNASILANKIKNALNSIEYIQDYKNISTPSIGVTLFKDDSITIQGIIKQADEAMYMAKKQGKNTIEFFN